MIISYLFRNKRKFICSLKKKYCERMTSQKNCAEMTDEELATAAYGEGIPPKSRRRQQQQLCCGIPSKSLKDEDPIHRVITISMDSETTQMPFGIVNNEAFLELFWRKTGADCEGEEEFMKLHDGYTYLISLATHCE